MPTTSTSGSPSSRAAASSWPTGPATSRRTCATSTTCCACWSERWPRPREGDVPRRHGGTPSFSLRLQGCVVHFILQAPVLLAGTLGQLLFVGLHAVHQGRIPCRHDLDREQAGVAR